MTLAFDVYGTLFDTTGVASALRAHVGDAAEHVAARWRSKQLEYAFRRALMGRYADFGVCTRQALISVMRESGVGPTDDDIEALMAVYHELPLYPDVVEALSGLRAEGLDMYAFSNGPASSVHGLLERAAVLDMFEDVISVETVESFKPDPAVYRHFLSCTGSRAEEAWLISGNPFDVIGALAARWRAVWVRRQPQQVFDPWEYRPTVVVTGLRELRDVLG